MKKTMMMLFTLVAVQAYGQSGPKVFIESENPGYSKPKYWDKEPSKIISLLEIIDRFQKTCHDCQVTIKKEAADYVVAFAASQGWNKKNWSWTVYENKEGMVLKKGETSVFNNSIKDAVMALSLHYIDIKRQENER
jgi:hypothetical protein